MKNTGYIIFLLFVSLACANSPAAYNNEKSTNIVDDGFQTKDARNGTTSAASIETENELTTLDNYLRQVSGVTVVGSGSSAQVRIRGIKSFTGNPEPLFVIDGLPINGGLGDVMNMIEVRDIERVTVLKGGSATTLYGVRGTAGVIVITSKK